jgi:hypothetical protein
VRSVEESEEKEELVFTIRVSVNLRKQQKHGKHGKN